jgi:hypothetical protein
MYTMVYQRILGLVVDWISPWSRCLTYMGSVYKRKNIPYYPETAHKHCLISTDQMKTSDFITFGTGADRITTDMLSTQSQNKSFQHSLEENGY